MRKGSLVY